MGITFTLLAAMNYEPLCSVASKLDHVYVEISPLNSESNSSKSVHV